MKEYTFKFRHVIEVEVTVSKNSKAEAKERAMESMDIYGESFLAEDEDDIYEAGTRVWLGGRESETCANVIQRTGWEMVK